jgi:hypothetical protein
MEQSFFLTRGLIYSFLKVAVLLCLICFVSYSQHSNIRITTGATSGGSFVLTGTGGYRFTPTADNAVINVGELQTFFAGQNYMEITTSRSGGTQAGNVIFETDLIQLNARGTAATRTFKIIAGGKVEFNANFTLQIYEYSSNVSGYDLNVSAGAGVSVSGKIDLSGRDSGYFQNYGRAGNVSMSITGDLFISGQVLTKGWNNLELSSGYNGGAGGSQNYVVSGTVTLTTSGILNASGGIANNGSGVFALWPTGGNGAFITLETVGSVTLSGSVISQGGNAWKGGNGGALTLNSSTSWLNYSGKLDTQSGSTKNGIGSTTQIGGNISLRGSGGLSLRANINSSRSINTIGQAGTLNLSTDNVMLTSGGGINDGQSAGIWSVGDVVKSGSGNLGIGGSNDYEGATWVNSGTLTLLRSESIPQGSVFYFNGGTWATNGFTENLDAIVISENSTLAFGSGAHYVKFRYWGYNNLGKVLTVTGWNGTFPGNRNLTNLDSRGLILSSSSRFVTSNGVRGSTGGVNQYGQINNTGTAGTAGKFYITSTPTTSQLDGIKFLNPSDASLRVSKWINATGTYEIVPDFAR